VAKKKQMGGGDVNMQKSGYCHHQRLSILQLELHTGLHLPTLQPYSSIPPDTVKKMAEVLDKLP